MIQLVLDNNVLYNQNNKYQFNELQSYERKEIRNQLIKQVGIGTLKELTISSIFTGITCMFVAAPAIPTLITTTIAILAFGVLLRTLTAAVTYSFYCNKQDNAGVEDPVLSKIVACLNYLNPITFAAIDISTRDCLVHEGGHALAAMAIYKNANPKIEVFPFIGGVTSYSGRHLSRLGEFLGKNYSNAIVSGAGAGASILVASAYIGLAHRFQETHPEFTRYCKCTAIASIVQHVVYALSALAQTGQSGHDFLSLWAVGIHPIASAAVIVAVPLIVKTGFFIADQLRKTNNKQEEI